MPERGLQIDRHLPGIDRLSMLSATVLLVYATSRFIEIPSRQFDLQLPGLYLAVQISTSTLVALLVAGLTAAGADWLVRDHPAYRERMNSSTALGRLTSAEHWLLPALTAWVIELPLLLLPGGLIWWTGFAFGGALLILVLVGEYITVDPNDVRHPVAAAGLTAMAFALFLVLASALRFNQARLFLLLPTLLVAAGLVCLRALRLRAGNRWQFLPAMITALLSGQIAAALHYWPLSPVAFGLAVLGPAYALTSLFSNLSEGQPFRQGMIEPGIILGFLWGIAAWIG